MTENRLGDAPIEEKYRQKMSALAAALDHLFNGENAGPRAVGAKDKRRVGFCLMVYEFGENPGRCNFISNGADRRDLVVLFKEMIARFSGQPEMKGRA